MNNKSGFLIGVVAGFIISILIYYFLGSKSSQYPTLGIIFGIMGIGMILMGLFYVRFRSFDAKWRGNTERPIDNLLRKSVGKQTFSKEEYIKKVSNFNIIRGFIFFGMGLTWFIEAIIFFILGFL